MMLGRRSRQAGKRCGCVKNVRLTSEMAAKLSKRKTEATPKKQLGNNKLDNSAALKKNMRLTSKRASYIRNDREFVKTRNRSNSEETTRERQT